MHRKLIYQLTFHLKKIMAAIMYLQYVALYIFSPAPSGLAPCRFLLPYLNKLETERVGGFMPERPVVIKSHHLVA